MFRRSASSQPDLFSSFESHFKGRKQAQLNDPMLGIMYAHITCKIDEDVFSVLFDRVCRMLGRRLVSMMIGWALGGAMRNDSVLCRRSVSSISQSDWGDPLLHAAKLK